MREHCDPCHVVNGGDEAEDPMHSPKAVEAPASGKAKLQAPKKTEVENTFTHCMAAVSSLPCLFEAPAPPTARGTSGPRRRRRTELEMLQPSAEVKHKLLRGAKVTEPMFVGSMRSGCL